MIKTLATAVALILTFSIATTAFAQNQTAATGLQIQIVPQIQRGHQQHLTIFSVDDSGNQVNASEIQTTITNQKGNLVGPKTLYTDSGEDVAYKVGPNTSPQNITVDSCLTEQDLCATQSYYVFPKGQAQQPLPLPPVMPEPEPPVANNTGDGEIILPDNSTDVTTPEGGNDTLPEQPVPELPPVANETAPSGNETIELPPTPVTNETTPTPLPINETAGGNETIPVPIPINETQANETVPLPELPVGNETQNATVEPEPLPPSENGGQTPNGTTPVEPEPETPTNGNTTTTEPEAPVNATDAFNELQNTTAILDQKLDEVFDNGNETNRAELKGLVFDTAGAIGGISETPDATDDQLLILQGGAQSISESINEILAADDSQAETNGEDDQGEDEQ